MLGAGSSRGSALGQDGETDAEHAQFVAGLATKKSLGFTSIDLYAHLRPGPALRRTLVMGHLGNDGAMGRIRPDRWNELALPERFFGLRLTAESTVGECSQKGSPTFLNPRPHTTRQRRVGLFHSCHFRC